MSLSANELEEKLSAIDTTLTLLEGELEELQETLGTEAISSLDAAKGNVALAYSMALLTHACLQLRGCPKDHPIYKDLTRIKSYIGKVRKAEEEASETSRKRLNTEAAGRFIKNFLGRPLP